MASSELYIINAMLLYLYCGIYLQTVITDGNNIGEFTVPY